jgi:starch-binding outer membrane protein, SusD/RagB family
MKKLIYILSVFTFIGMMYSCEEQFLQVPNTTGTVNLEKVYSDSTLAIKNLVNNYRVTFTTGWGGFTSNNYSIAWFHGNISAISGEIVKGQPWHANYVFANTGPSPVQVPPIPGVSMMNPYDAQSIVPLNRLYNSIRLNYLGTVNK